MRTVRNPPVTCTSSMSGRLRPVSPPRRLTTQGLAIQGLAWTRDGASIVYDTSGRGPFQLWRVKADGAQAPERIEVAGFGSSRPATVLSRDRLVFQRRLPTLGVYAVARGTRQSPFWSRPRSTSTRSSHPMGNGSPLAHDARGKQSRSGWHRRRLESAPIDPRPRSPTKRTSMVARRPPNRVRCPSRRRTLRRLGDGKRWQLFPPTDRRPRRRECADVVS